MSTYDVLGNIALFKFSKGMKKSEKVEIAREFIINHPKVNTVLEKTDKIKGRLRTPETKFILGEKNKECLYKENGCSFVFNVDTCYFSPRLSSERKYLADITKKGESVLVMFGGVAPFAVVIAKSGKPKRVVSMELNMKAQKYAIENVRKNNVNVEIIQGDVKKKLPRMKEKFDRIVMARPNLKDSFLSSAFSVSKKGTIIHYYGFYHEDKIDELRNLIKEEAKKAKKKIRIQSINKAGDIGVRTYRYRVDFKLL